MPVNPGFGAHGEFGHGEHADDVTGFVTVGVTESFPLLAADARSIVAALSRSDMAAALVSEARTLAATLDRADGVSVSLQPAVSLFAALSTLSDALTVTLDDAGAVMAYFSETDTVTVSVEDAGAVAAVLVRGDTLTLAIAEDTELFTTVLRSETLSAFVMDAASILANLDTVSDSVLLTVSSAGVIVVAHERAETVPIDVSGEIILPIPVHLSRDDVLSVLTERLVSGQDFGGHGEFAHGEHARDRGSAPIIREFVEIFATLSRVDALSPTVNDAATAFTVLSRLDALLTQIEEGDAFAELRLHRRISNVIQY